MIDFFVKYTNDPEESQAWHYLKEIRPDARMFAGVVRFHFRSRAGILLVGYPKLAWFAVRSALRSLVLSQRRPKAVILESDVEILVFSGMLSLLRARRGTGIAFSGFIYTPRRSRLKNRLRRIYYGLVLSRCDCVICHSRIEVENYGALFPGASSKFVFVPWGAHFHGWQDISAEESPAVAQRRLRVLSVGRSQRDYQTLTRAVADETGIEATIICDQQESLSGITEAGNIRILRSCYGKDYLEELRSCDVVVIPLATEDISAGQMVLVQAMSYAKPVVISRTATTEDYVTDGVNGLLVPLRSADDMRLAIRRLRDDRELYRALQKGARDSYEQSHTQAAFLRNLVHAVEHRLQIGPSMPREAQP